MEIYGLEKSDGVGDIRGGINSPDIAAYQGEKLPLFIIAVKNEDVSVSHSSILLSHNCC